MYTLDSSSRTFSHISRMRLRVFELLLCSHLMDNSSFMVRNTIALSLSTLQSIIKNISHNQSPLICFLPFSLSLQGLNFIVGLLNTRQSPFQTGNDLCLLIITNVIDKLIMHFDFLNSSIVYKSDIRIFSPYFIRIGQFWVFIDLLIYCLDELAILFR